MITSVTTLVLRTRRLANMVNRNTVTDPEICDYLTDANHRLKALLVRHGLVTGSTLAQLVPISGRYYLPEGAFAIEAVYRLQGDKFIPLRRGTRESRVNSVVVAGAPQEYRFVSFDSQVIAMQAYGGEIEFYPTNVTETLWVRYVPGSQLLTLLGTEDNSTASVAYPQGWEWFLCYDAAQACLSREESINPILNQRLEKIVRAIEDEAAQLELRETSFVENRTQDRVQDPADLWWCVPADI